MTKDGKKTGGKPKGYKAPATLAKEAAREAVRVRVTQRLIPLVDAQIDSAIGIKHFFLRGEDGQWRRIKSASQIEQALNHPDADSGKTFWIYTKDPNSQAAREMLDRAIDRPKEQEQVIKLDNVNELVAELQQARMRAARARKD